MRFKSLASWESILPILVAVAAALVVVPRLTQPLHRTVAIAAFVAYIIFVVWLSRRSRETRLVTLICQIAALLGLYSAEVYAANRRYQTTSLLAYVDRLRAQGEQVWPVISPSAWYLEQFRSEIDAGRMPLALAGRASVKTLFCYRDAQWLPYVADRFGFRNPARTATEESYDAVLIGDSFVNGLCEPEPATIAGHMRAAGLSTLNLGMTGIGPLYELGILQEYAAIPHAKHVVWFFYEGNDIYDLVRESSSPLLMRYLAEGPFQHLEQHQSEVDAAFDAHVFKLDTRFSVVNILRLQELRSLVGLLSIGQGGIEQRTEVEPRMELLGRILDRARKRAADQGSSFDVVYLPAPYRYEAQPDDVAYARSVETAVAGVICRMKIPMLSITRILDKTANPRTYFGENAHFNADGYRVTSAALLDYLAGGRQDDCRSP